MANTNPLLDIVEKARQQKYNEDLADIKRGLKSIMENQKPMTRFIEVTTPEGEIISVNPKYILAVCDGLVEEEGIKKGGRILYYDGSYQETKETREMLTALINGPQDKTVIG